MHWPVGQEISPYVEDDIDDVEKSGRTFSTTHLQMTNTTRPEEAFTSVGFSCKHETARQSNNQNKQVSSGKPKPTY